jgi:hypothetical protein
LHVVQKPWVNPDQFFEAFKVAIDAHEGRYAGKVDPALLNASFEMAVRMARHKRPTGDTVFSTDRFSGKYQSHSLGAC